MTDKRDGDAERDMDTPFTRMASKYLECDAALRKKDAEIARLRFAARVVDAARKVVSPDITYLDIPAAHRELKAALAEYDAASDGDAEPHVVDVSFADRQDAEDFYEAAEELLLQSGQRGTLSLRGYDRANETQQSISDWADACFGPATGNARIAVRANEEMAELLRALTADDHHPKAGEEIADIVIVLYRLARNLGVDLITEINRKMAVNRAREWRLDATGCGYHVR